MAKKTSIGAGLVLDGEKEFKQAVSGINKDLSVLTSEMGKVTAQFASNSNSMSALTAKSEVYNKQIDAQKQKIETLKVALANSAQQYGENDNKTKNWQISLNKAEAELAKTENSLQNTTSQMKALENSTDQAKSATNSIEKQMQQFKNEVVATNPQLQKNIDLMKKAAIEAGSFAAKGLQALAKGFIIYAEAVAAAGAAVFALTVKSAGAADELNTLAAQTGLSTDTLQRFQYATEIIDVDMETLTKGLGRTTKAIGAATAAGKDYIEITDGTRVSIRDANGALLDSETVFNNSIAALAAMTNETEREIAAQKLFGKSYQEIMPLIRGGADTLRLLGDEAARSGLILSKEALNGLNAFQDSLDRLKAIASASGKVIAGAFAGGFKAITDVIGDNIPKIAGAIAGLFSGRDADEMAENLQEGFTDIFTKVFEGFINNLPNFLTMFNTFIISLVTSLNKLLPTAVQTLLPVLISSFFNLVNGLVAQLPTMVPMLVTGALLLFRGLIDGLNETIPLLTAELPGMIDQIFQTLMDNLPAIINGGFQIIIALTLGFANAIPNLIKGVIDLIPVIIQALMDNLPALVEAGVQLTIALIIGILQAIPQILAALPQIIEAIQSGLRNVNWGQVGIDIIKGIGQGMIDAIKSSWLDDLIRQSAQKMVQKYKGALGIASPSKVMADQIGKFMPMGIGEGFKKQMPSLINDINGQMATLTDKISPNVNISKMGSSNNTYSAAGMFTGAVFNIRSDNDIKSLAKEVSREMYRLQVQGAR